MNVQLASTWLITSIYFIQPVTQGDITGYQVHYNGTMMNVTSSTTTLTFTAPSLPDGVFTGTTIVMVTAVNRYGMGPASDPAIARIYGQYLYRHSYVCTYVLMHRYLYIVIQPATQVKLYVPEQQNLARYVAFKKNQLGIEYLVKG